MHPFNLGMKREYKFLHPMVDYFCGVEEIVPTHPKAALRLMVGKGPFHQRVVLVKDP